MKIAFKKPTTIWEKILAMIMKSKYCHVEFYFDGGELTFGANIDGVKFRRYNGEPYWEIFDIPLSETNNKLIYLYCVYAIDKKYDWRGIVCNFLIRKDSHNRNRYFCSEFVTEKLQEVGYVDVAGLVPHKTHVEKLYKALFGRKSK
jgi:hypothetical protein